MAIALTTLLILSPLDARHLLEALLRLIHIPVPVDIAPAPEVPPPKAIDVTLVRKPPAPKAEPPAPKASIAPAAARTAPPTGTPAGGEAALTKPEGSGTVSPPQGVAPQQPTAAIDRGAALQGTVVAASGEEAPISETTGKTTSKDSGTNHGLEVPALTLSLTAAEIAQLLATGAAVVVAASTEGKATYVLGTEHRFTAATTDQMASISSRGFPVGTANLAGPWSTTLKREEPGASFEFTLHFSNAAEAIIVGEQLDAVKAKGIDLNKEMAAGHVVVTDGAIDPNTLNFHIVGVSER